LGRTNQRLIRIFLKIIFAVFTKVLKMTKLLIFNHFFEQDISAIFQLTNQYNIRTEILHYPILAKLANRYFPKSVFSSLSAYLEPQYENQRGRYREACEKLFRRLYFNFRFDAIISPSDSFFYIRDFIEIAQSLDIPFIVLQKETTIDPYTMEKYSQEIKKYLPFISDLMLVCSENHRNFWIKTGADGEKIKVIGQPRFDIYHCLHNIKSLRELGLKVNNTNVNILFFSYHPKFYFPDAQDENGSWSDLLQETQRVLVKMAAKNNINVLIKPHPQQIGIEGYKQYLKNLRSLCGNLWQKQVFLVPPELDTRQLILNVDKIVGFQTTALFEAMITQKKVIYTFWTESALKHSQYLIPFHQYEKEIHVARSPQELELYILSDNNNYLSDSQVLGRTKAFQYYLGASDGLSSQRAIKEILSEINRHNPKIIKFDSLEIFTFLVLNMNEKFNTIQKKIVNLLKSIKRGIEDFLVTFEQ